MGFEKRALILIGGSVRGIFQVGVLTSIIKKYPNIEYFFVGGNSVGAINASHIAQYPIGMLGTALRDLYNIWGGLNSKEDLWKVNFLTVMKALFTSDNGIGDPAPLQKLIRDNYNPEKAKASGRELRISTSEVLNCELIEFTQENTTWEHIYGSAAMPFGLPAILVDDLYLSDGASMTAGPIKSAITCGFTKIDIIFNGPLSKQKQIPPVEYKAVKRIDRFAMRLLNMILYRRFVYEMRLCLLYNLLAKNGLADKAEVDVKIYAPKDTLADDFILMDLNKEKLGQWYEEGLRTEPITLEEFLAGL